MLSRKHNSCGGCVRRLLLRKEQVITQRDQQDFFNSIFFLFYSGGEVTRVKSRCGRTGKLMESGYMMCYSQRINFLKLNKKKEFLVDEHMGFFFQTFAVRMLFCLCTYLLIDFYFIAVEWISISRIREKT